MNKEEEEEFNERNGRDWTCHNQQEVQALKSFITENYISRSDIKEWVEKINVSGYKDSSGVADFIWSIIKRDFLEFIEKK